MSACSHGPGCSLPWSVHDWSYEVIHERMEVQNAPFRRRLYWCAVADSGRLCQATGWVLAVSMGMYLPHM